MKIKFKKLNKNATTPTKANPTDAGFDMVAVSKDATDKFIEYGTGIAIEIPDGYAGFLYSRSSVTKKDLMLKNSVGVIDSGYRGEIKFRFNKVANFKLKNEITHPDISTQYNIVYNNDIYQIGDKIGQIIFQKLPDVELEEVDELNDSERGTGGFGSTGK